MKNNSAAPAKCCSGILRRFLCSGSLPTHPSDHFLDPNPSNVVTKIPHHEFTKPYEAANNVKHAPTPSSPGVVARLMGLDSFPHTAAMVSKNTTLGSLLRSRSVNSIDFLLHFDPAVKKGHQQQQHRRVRTSVSFREGVVNDECISSAVLELEKVDETAADGYEEADGLLVNRKKPNVKYQKVEKERKPRDQKGENFQEERVAKKPAVKSVEMEERKRSDLIFGQKKDFQGTRPVIRRVKSKQEPKDLKPCVKKRKNKVCAHRDRVQSGSNLKKIYPEGSVSEVARGVRSRSPSLSKDAFPQESWSVSAHDSEVTATIGIRKNEKKMKGKEGYCIGQMVEEICRATEDDVRESMECGMGFRFEEFEEICQQFGQEILQVLLKQLVAELVPLYGTREVNLYSV